MYLDHKTASGATPGASSALRGTFPLRTVQQVAQCSARLILRNARATGLRPFVTEKARARQRRAGGRPLAAPTGTLVCRCKSLCSHLWGKTPPYIFRGGRLLLLKTHSPPSLLKGKRRDVFFRIKERQAGRRENGMERRSHSSPGLYGRIIKGKDGVFQGCACRFAVVLIMQPKKT